MSARWEFRILLFLAIVIVVLASVLSKKGQGRRGLAFIVAWLIPGAGHVLMGKWRKGMFLFAILAATYLAGLAIVGFKSPAFSENPFYFIGQFGSGATYAASKFLIVEKSYPQQGLPPSWYDPGLLYICVVGLLNLVLMMNILEIKMAAAPSSAPPAVSAPAPAKAPEEENQETKSADLPAPGGADESGPAPEKSGGTA